MTRRFLQVGHRRVHYFRAGDGPPAVLVHSSPASARLLAKEIDRLSAAFTVFAFDTPGFGLSDPLPLTEMTVADLADAMAETLGAIGMPPCPIFGTHTGAAIALEFGVRHPERATGLVLDGVPAFTDAECEAYFATYFKKMPPSELGGHFAEAWTRFRDQSIWFPWTNKTPEHFNPYDLSPPHSTHLWVSMFFEAADHYAPAYRAASYYGARAIAAAEALTLPAVYCATETDMLHPHLDRLPPMKVGQAIVPIGNAYARRRELIAESFARFGAQRPAPKDKDAIGSSDGVSRQFIDGTEGQVHLRFAGDRAAPPLLLLHDAPGSSEQSEPLIAALSTRFFVIAPDLPGNGESDAFPKPPTAERFAAEALHVLRAVGVKAATVYGVGFGSSIAVALAADHPAQVTALMLESLALPTVAERDDLRRRYAPEIAIEADGAHWYRTWLMLRDSLVYWPWYDRTLKAQRDITADLTAAPLHRWTMDVMRARTSYHHLIHAALDYAAGSAITHLAVPFARVADGRSPLSAYDDRLRALASGSAEIPASTAAIADAAAQFSLP